MRHLKYTAVIFLALAACLYGQMAISPGRRTGAAASHAVATTTLGETNVTTSATDELNGGLYTTVETDGSTHTVDSCSIHLASQGAAGGHLECGIYSAAGFDPSVVLCHASYTETGKTGDQVITIPLSGCGTLAASTAYVIFENTDDAGVAYDYYTCGSSCSSVWPSATFNSLYVAQTYGTYPSFPSMSGSNIRLSLHITIH